MASEQNPAQSFKVGIIGAGFSGIAAAKQLRHYDPAVLEATNSIGGVWKHCTFNSTKLQSPRSGFEFSDFSWPKRDYNASFPSHDEILDYLQDYASHFDVLKFIKFNSKVIEIRQVKDNDTTRVFATTPGEYGSLLRGYPVWEVAVKIKEQKAIQWYAFELLVVCIGKYGDIPKMPTFPAGKGEEVFNGKVLHSMDYSKLNKEEARELLQGKKVAIIGYKKSAVDLAVECAEANQGPNGRPCTMVIRTLHWALPSYRIWGLPFFLFYSTRSSQFLHQRPNLGFLRNFLCFLLSPMRKVISKFIESYLMWKLPLKKFGLIPDHPFEEDYASCQMAILPENFFSKVEKGNILFKRASKWWFWNGGIEFEDESKLEADVVLLATGYDVNKKLQSILPKPIFNVIVDSTGIMPLYRATIHPRIPNMAFVGYIEIGSNLQTNELRCKWLARLADQKFKLPSVDNMLRQTHKEMEIMKKTSRFFDRNCISTYSIHHRDEICEDMGWKSWRKNNWLLEAFSPYGSQDYQE